MKRIVIHLFLILVTVVVVAPAQAQDLESADTVSSLPGIEITTSVDNAEAYIGDLITYKVTVTYDSTITLEPSPIGANLGSFDVKDYNTDVTRTLEDGRKQTENTFVLSTFTTGDYIIPPLPIVFTLPDGERKILLSDSVPIKIKSLLENESDSVDIRPAKPQYQFLRDWTYYYIWGGVALVVILVGLFLWWRWRRKRLEEGEPVDLRPPWEIAFEKLALLKQEELPQKQEYKEYYFRLTELAREYVGRVYRINVLDMTTEEFVGRVNELDMPDDSSERTIEFLRHADLVKFAKFVPENGRTDVDFEFVHDLVEKIRIDHLRREAEKAQALREARVDRLPEHLPPDTEEPEPKGEQADSTASESETTEKKS
jgi:hypothetical protein